MRLLLVPALLVSLLAFSACYEDEGAETSDIVSTIPWPDQERAEYVVLDRDGEDERGRGVISINRQGDEFEVLLHFEGGGDTDESVVVVHADTLKPISVSREIDREDGEDEAFRAEYDEAEGVIRVVQIDEDGDERTVPRRLEEDHYYDNEPALFVWRAIDFRDDYRASYYSVLANQGGVQQLVSLRVTGKETVTVPAGTFEAWRLEMRSEGFRQTVWYADTPTRPLLQYDNSRQLLQLTSIDPPVESTTPVSP